MPGAQVNQLGTWAQLVRRFLAFRDVHDLHEAIAELRKGQHTFRYSFASWRRRSISRKVLPLLESWLNAEYLTLLRRGQAVINKLQAYGLEAEAQTITLLCYEITIQPGEAYQSFSALERQRVIEPAIEACKDCVDIALALGDSACAASYMVRLGNGYYSAQHWMAALAAFRDALKLWLALSEQKPELYSVEIARTWKHIGSTFSKMQELNEAFAALQEALDILEKGQGADPFEYHRELAEVKNALALVYQAAHGGEKALELFEASVELMAGLTWSVNKSREYRLSSLSFRPPVELDLSRILLNLGHLLCDLNRSDDDLERAQQYFEQAVAIQSALPRTGVNPTPLQIARTKCGLGRVHYEMGRVMTSFQEEAERINHYRAARAQIEVALAIQREHVSSGMVDEVFDLVTSLRHLGAVLGLLKEISAAKALLDEAILRSKQQGFLLELALALHMRSAVEVWESGDLLAGLHYDSQAIAALESSLAQSTIAERANYDLFKARIEISYGVCIAHYAREHELAKLFDLLETLREPIRLSTLQRGDLNQRIEYTLEQAVRFVAEHQCPYLAIQIVPGGMVFLAISASGDVQVQSIGKGWLQKSLVLFHDVNRIMKESSRDVETGLFPKNISEHIEALRDAGRNLFQLLPAEIQNFLMQDMGSIFLSPYGELQNVPFELMVLPDNSWLGLSKLLPRVHSFAELCLVASRKPNARRRIAVVFGDPHHNLPFARSAASNISELWQRMGFRIGAHDAPVLGEHVNATSFLRGFEQDPVFFLYCGHGDQDKYGGFLALSSADKIRPNDIVVDSLHQGPVVHYDCCEAGVSRYHFGGQIASIARATITAGASCCLLSNRVVFDRVAASLSQAMYRALLEQELSIGAALIHARNEIARVYNHPLCWAFPVLYGNPSASFFEQEDFDE